MDDKIVRKYCGDFVFVDIPKTATGSILKAIRTHCTNADKALENAGRHKPLHARIIDGSAPEDVFRFSVVRNPYDRFVSNWYWVKFCAIRNNDPRFQTRHTDACQRYIQQTPDFKTHVQNVHMWTKNNYENYKKLMKSDMVRPPGRWLRRRVYSPNSNHVLMTMVNMISTSEEPQLPAVDAVLRFERLAADWKQLCDRLGIEHVELPMHNVSYDREAKWSAYYDAESYATINEVYADDFKIFNYTMKT